MPLGIENTGNMAVPDQLVVKTKGTTKLPKPPGLPKK